jgi:HPr kinase/phosphorylase
VTPGAATRAIRHATAVAVDGRGLLIMGASGAGKSSLALALIGLGAALVSDDQTQLERCGPKIVLGCPTPPLRGVIEVRGMGLLRAPAVDAADLALVVDLDAVETQRFPAARIIEVMGCDFPLVRTADHAHFPVALMLQLRHGRHA